MRNQFCDVRFCLEERGRRVLQFIIGNEIRLRRRQILPKASYQRSSWPQLEGKGEVWGRKVGFRRQADEAAAV